MIREKRLYKLDQISIRVYIVEMKIYQISVLRDFYKSLIWVLTCTKELDSKIVTKLSIK